GFTKRADDNPDALKVRLREYHDKTAPLLELFDNKSMLVRIDAIGSIEEVYQSMVTTLGLSAPVKNE
ncbi:MAG: hypothetical protein GY953_34405, partial [bacterium]|nr:hypothetical protein [bacterium]